MNTHSCNDLLEAVSGGHESCVRELIAAGIDPNVADNHGNTPLHRVALGGYKACFAALIAAGADPNAVNDDGYTSLHWAVYNNHEACVAALIAAGADPNAVNNIRQTPLQIAVKKGHRECAKVLAVRVLADRALTDDEWGLVPPGSDVGHLLPVVMTRDGRDAAAKLVARLSEEKKMILEMATLCLSRVVLRDVVERIAVLCV